MIWTTPACRTRLPIALRMLIKLSYRSPLIPSDGFQSRLYQAPTCSEIDVDFALRASLDYSSVSSTAQGSSRTLSAITQKVYPPRSIFRVSSWFFNFAGFSRRKQALQSIKELNLNRCTWPARTHVLLESRSATRNHVNAGLLASKPNRCFGSRFHASRKGTAENFQRDFCAKKQKFLLLSRIRYKRKRWKTCNK